MSKREDGVHNSGDFIIGHFVKHRDGHKAMSDVVGYWEGFVVLGVLIVHVLTVARCAVIDS